MAIRIVGIQKKILIKQGHFSGKIKMYKIVAPKI